MPFNERITTQMLSAVAAIGGRLEDRGLDANGLAGPRG
jgi:hypothetical protein